MTTDPTLFDLDAARHDRDVALERVARRGYAMERAQRAANHVSKRNEFFTAEDIREAMRVHDPEGFAAVNDEPRVLGATMQWLKRTGRAVPTERHVQTGRRSNHARPQRVWRRTCSP